MKTEKSKLIRKFIATHELFTRHELSVFLSEIGTHNIGTQQQIHMNLCNRSCRILNSIIVVMLITTIYFLSL